MRTTAIRKPLVGLLGAALLAVGGSLATAPTAAAVGGSACTVNIKNKVVQVGFNGANIRNGPGVKYKKKGYVPPRGSFYAVCYTTNKHGNVWMYGTPTGTTYNGWFHYL
ncbi:hypothetical protein ACIBKX_02940 [Streptomyces sp. NPDC050658]|uniref:hypothetical protein n=1 Tax=unclassified Streptomyces TaxID=2593676 RepID=UPI0034193C90